MTPRRYELLVFDWDGTLADSAGLIVAGMQRAIGELKLPVRSDAQIRELIGLGFYDAMARLFPEFGPEDIAKALADYRRLLLAGGHLHHGPAEAPLFDGALDALRELHRAGYRLAVATGKSRSSLDRSFAKHPELRALFSSSRCADETASKPDPLMLQELLEHEDLPPDAALMIGDTEFDMQMARAAKVGALGVACGVHEHQRLHEAGALGVIDAVSHLGGWLRVPGAAP
jgi:phosphoglycolate phosphatase